MSPLPPARRYPLGELTKNLLTVPPKPVHVRREPQPGDDLKPAAAFNAHFTEGDVLEWMGCEFVGSNYQGDQWVRPGKSVRDGSSATVYHGEDSHVTIYSDTLTAMFPGVEIRRPYDAFGLFAAAFHGGDFSAAAKGLEAEGYGEMSSNDSELDDYVTALRAAVDALDEDEDEDGDNRSSWDFYPIEQERDGSSEMPPTIFGRLDGVFLVYPAKEHMFYGEPESGKSWAGHCVIAETLNKGGKACLVDFENMWGPVRGRLRGLGVADDVLFDSGRFKFLNPDEGWNERAARGVKAIAEYGFDVVIIDGTTDAYGLLGLDLNDSKDATEFVKRLVRPVAKAGAAVITIDHVAKSKENRHYSIGAQGKKGALTGSMFEFVKMEQFGRRRKGMSQIFVRKDRPGYVREHERSDECIGDFWLDGTDPDHLEWVLLPPTVASGEDQASGHVMGELFSYVEQHEGALKSSILAAGSQAPMPLKRAAFDELDRNKYILNDFGDRNRWRANAEKPYRWMRFEERREMAQYEQRIREVTAPIEPMPVGVKANTQAASEYPAGGGVFWRFAGSNGGELDDEP